MSDELEAARIKLEIAKIDADEAHWNQVRDLLVQVMRGSGLPDGSLTTVTLNALLQVLPGDPDAIDMIAKRLRVFADFAAKEKT